MSDLAEGGSTTVASPEPMSVRQAGAAFEALMGGSDGDEPTPTPENTEGEPEAADEGGAEEPKEESEEPEEDSDKSEPEDQDPGDEDAPPAINTVEELAQALGKTPEEVLAGIKHKFKVAGEEAELSLSELVSGYQRDGDYRQKTQKLAEERNQLRQAHAQVAREYERRAASVAGMLRAEQEAVRSYMDSGDIARLKTENPAEWLVQKDWAESRLRSINQALEAGHNEWLKAREAEAKLKIDEGVKWIRSRRPDFGEEHGKKAMATLKGEYNYSDDELRSLDDMRVVAMATEIAELRERVAKEEAAKTKGKEAIKAAKPTLKLLKPGAPKRERSEAQKQATEVMRAAGRLKETGRVKDAGEAFYQMMLAGEAKASKRK